MSRVPFVFDYGAPAHSPADDTGEDGVDPQPPGEPGAAQVLVPAIHGDLAPPPAPTRAPPSTGGAPAKSGTRVSPISRIVASEAQYEKACRRTALEVQKALVAGRLSEAELMQQTPHITRKDYDDVVEERSVARVCGYPVCEAEAGGGVRARLRERGDFAHDFLAMFCSLRCAKRSKFFAAQLSEEPVHLRSILHPVPFAVPFDAPDTAHARPAPVIKRTPLHANPYGADAADAPRSGAPVDLVVRERDPGDVPVAPDTTPLPALESNAHLVGHLAHGSAERARLTGSTHSRRTKQKRRRKATAEPARDDEGQAGKAFFGGAFMALVQLVMPGTRKLLRGEETADGGGEEEVEFLHTQEATFEERQRAQERADAIELHLLEGLPEGYHPRYRCLVSGAPPDPCGCAGLVPDLMGVVDTMNLTQPPPELPREGWRIVAWTLMVAVKRREAGVAWPPPEVWRNLEEYVGIEQALLESMVDYVWEDI